MPNRRRVVKLDGNHAAIANGLRDVGLKVIEVARYGCPWDLLVLARVPAGRIPVMLEVKASDKEKLTESEQALKDDGWPVVVVTTVDEALMVCGNLDANRRLVAAVKAERERTR